MKNQKTFCNRFKQNVHQKLNPIFARYRFYNETQCNESINDFVTRLKLRAQHCEFADMKEMIRDRIVFGTNSQKTKSTMNNSLMLDVSCH